MPTPSAQTPPQLLVGRQPILDLDQELAGYALSFHRADGDPDDVQSTTAEAVCAAFAELGLDTALGPHRAHLRIDTEFLCSDVVELLPAASIVLALDIGKADTAADTALAERCTALRQRGYRLALAGYEGRDATALLPHVDIVGIDLATAGDLLSTIVPPLVGFRQAGGNPLQLLATGVDTREQMAHCRDLGFNLFQGYYFARPRIVAGRHLSASQLSLIRLINLVAREADSAEIEAQFKREPALTVNLLRLVNAVGFGAVQKVESLPHAIAILGRRQLLRWLQLLLMASSGSGDAPERNPLLQLAAQRGHLMESLAGHCRERLGDEAFLTGIMSLMPAALDLPIDDILAQIPVADSLRDALAAHRGALGRLLALTEHLDDGDWPGCDAVLAELPALTPATVSGSLAEAMAWLHRDDDAL